MRMNLATEALKGKCYCPKRLKKSFPRESAELKPRDWKKSSRWGVLVVERMLVQKPKRR